MLTLTLSHKNTFSFVITGMVIIISVLEEAFNICDKDKNGTICSSEVGLVLRALGFNPTEREVKEMVAEIDKNSK